MSSSGPSTGTEAVKEFDDTIFVAAAGARHTHPADSTFQPALPATKAKGTKFTPFNLKQHRDLIVKDLPSTPLLLFQCFVPIFLVEKWVFYTNQFVESLQQDPKLVGRSFSRLRKWKPTSVEEIYSWLGILIHIGIHRETKIEDYWKIPQLKQQGTIHTIIRYMTYNRFFLLLRYIRIFEPCSKAINNTTYDRI